MKNMDRSSDEFERDLRRAMTYLDPPPELIDRLIAAASSSVGRRDRVIWWIRLPAFMTSPVWFGWRLWMSVAISISVVGLIFVHEKQLRHEQHMKADRDFEVSLQITEEVLREARKEIRDSDILLEAYKRETVEKEGAKR